MLFLSFRIVAGADKHDAPFFGVGGGSMKLRAASKTTSN
jgi:hypothetical protein